jgi:hypothetical protein
MASHGRCRVARAAQGLPSRVVARPEKAKPAGDIGHKSLQEAPPAFAQPVIDVMQVNRLLRLRIPSQIAAAIRDTIGACRTSTRDHLTHSLIPRNSIHRTARIRVHIVISYSSLCKFPAT